MRRELLGLWPPPDPDFLRAVKIWEGYDRETDAFDERHGARRNDRGEVGPAHPFYAGESSRFARRALGIAIEEGRRLGISAEVMEAARRKVLLAL